MELIIIVGGVSVMIWTSILMYRMAKNYFKSKVDIELPTYNDPPPPYTPRIIPEAEVE